jgi:hypothetical protein
MDLGERSSMTPSDFFNSLSGVLDIKLSEDPSRITPSLYNVAAAPNARIVSLSFKLEICGEDGFRDLTDADWRRVGFESPTIRLRSSYSATVVAHKAPNGAHFTVRDLAIAIEETERQSRGASNWFGGIDVHHIFFQGLHVDQDGVWEIAWGS